ncbi:formate/nitrite transporter family protein [Candidatus Scalindua japonica]|uniref:Formate/nitrite transporter family protein n=1 Tax=Candidatus Scalindua japonica TaxID=1284222 RepID=A0A286TZP8_9BACT|nr:formate/nitrite transporter family protein [Candidatus Scalindua japonica]GAX61328.1 formate/nitrite transporter family protein [Candidatus Scalindua japonica]
MKATVDTFAGVAVAKEDMIRNKFGQYWVLSMLAGMYIGFGILLIFTVGAQFAAVKSPAVKMVMGTSFALALLLVVFAGSELFTGNNMVMLIGCLRGKTGWGWMIWLWFVCWFGNLAGALLLALIYANTGLGDGNITGKFICKVAGAKMNAPFFYLFCRGILCNMLVCLAVWMSAKAKNEAARVFLIFWCLFAFIACGFEHCIANMTIFGAALFTTHPANVTCGGFAWNMAAASAGNIVGGCLIGLAYWFATYAPIEDLVPGGPLSRKAVGASGDGGRSISLVDPTQGAIPGGQIVGVDENDNNIVEVLPSSSRQG